MKYPSKAKEAIRATEMSPVTLAEALSLQDTQRKYGNEKVVINGQTFDSQAEYRRWRELCLMAQAGEIGDLLFARPAARNGEGIPGDADSRAARCADDGVGGQATNAEEYVHERTSLHDVFQYATIASKGGDFDVSRR